MNITQSISNLTFTTQTQLYKAVLTDRTLIALGVLLLAFLLPESGLSLSALAAPLFVCQGSCAAGCGDAYGGGGDGGGGGGSAGSSSDCGVGMCDGPGNSQSNPGCADSGSTSTGSGSSTPFLIHLDGQGKRTILNDVLSSHPSTQFSNAAHGLQQLAAGKVGYDVYPVALASLGVDQPLQFELKEIEYEQSFVSGFEYAFLSTPGNLAVGSDHHALFSYDAVQPLTAKITHSHDQSADMSRLTTNLTLAATSPQPRESSVLLQTSEHLEFTVTRAATGPTYIYMQAFWHELIGKTHMQHRIAAAYAAQESAAVRSPFAKLARRTTSYVSAMAVALLGSYAPLTIDDQSLLSAANKIPVAHASYPSGHSLHAQYLTDAGVWQTFTVSHPRFALTHPTLIELPDEVFGAGTQAQVRLHATADHCIYALGTASGVTEVTPTKMTSIEGTISTNGQRQVCTTDAPLETTPGSHYRFTLPTPATDTTHVVFKLNGIYTPLTPSSDNEVRDWWEMLSTDEQALFLS